MTEKYSAIVVGVEHMFDRLIQESGIVDPMQIAWNFIKDQDQWQNLYNYLREMKAEGQKYEDDIKKSRNEITSIYRKIDLEKIADERRKKEWEKMNLEKKIEDT